MLKCVCCTHSTSRLLIHHCGSLQALQHGWMCKADVRQLISAFIAPGLLQLLEKLHQHVAGHRMHSPYAVYDQSAWGAEANLLLQGSSSSWKLSSEAVAATEGLPTGRSNNQPKIKISMCCQGCNSECSVSSSIATLFNAHCLPK